MTTELLDLLKKLSTAVGIAGYEHSLRNLLQEQYAPYIDEFIDDPMGNLTMIKRGRQTGDDIPRRKIMITAHLDEIGAMVTKVDRGFIHFTKVGNLDRRFLIGQEVTIFGRQEYQGVIASRPPHFTLDARDKYPEIEAYQIDTGLPPDIVADNVRTGDLIALKKTPANLLGGLISDKALHARAAVASLYVCLKELSGLDHTWDVYAVATSQKEIGLKGAQTSTYRINPDVAIAIDTTPGNAPGVADGFDISLNEGPVIFRGANIHPGMVKGVKETAVALEINTQIKIEPADTDTDAWVIQVSRDGIPTGLICIPLRYMHSPVEMVSPNDIAQTGRLVAHFIADINEEFLTNLIPKEGWED